MVISEKTIHELQLMINEKTERRSGPELVSFFNNFKNYYTYGPGFPSRWKFTEDAIRELNGSPYIDECIKQTFAPINFVGRQSEWQNLINEFNQWLAFDGYLLKCIDNNLFFDKTKPISFNTTKSNIFEKSGETQENFINREFGEIDFNSMDIETTLKPILKSRLEEIKICINNNAPLSAVILCASTLEGVLLGIAQRNIKEFNTQSSTPKKDGKVKDFNEWSLKDYINVAKDCGFIKEDAKKFGEQVRDFRNYVHPYQQMCCNFSPSIETAKICSQVLKLCILQIIEKQKN